MMSGHSDVSRRFLDLIYPRWCAGCGAGMPGKDPGHICWECMRVFRLITHPYCELCGDPCDGELAGAYTCTLCRTHPPAFDRARSAVRYRGVVQMAVQAFKYNHAIHLVQDLGMLLEACCRVTLPMPGIDAVVAVPLFPKRQRERTYNQSALLAAWLAKRLNFEFGLNALIRTRETESQTTFSADERRRNVRGAFGVRLPEWVEGRRLLLIDDVMTTGATLDECSRELKTAGAVSVMALTVARG